MIHLHGHERPQQHRAVAERRPRLGEPRENLPEDGVFLEALGDDQVALDGHLDEVVVGPGQPVVHDVGRDDLDEEEGELLGRLFGRVAQLLLLLGCCYSGASGTCTDLKKRKLLATLTDMIRKDAWTERKSHDSAE